MADIIYQKKGMYLQSYFKKVATINYYFVELFLDFEA